MRSTRRTRLLALALVTATLLACRIGPQSPAPLTPTPVQAAATQAQVTILPLTPTARAPEDTPTSTVALTPTPMPAPTRTPVPAPTPTPPLPSAGDLPAVWTEIDFAGWHHALGEGLEPVPQGNYYPYDLLAGEGFVYVLGRCADDSLREAHSPPACLSTFDLQADRVMQTFELPTGYEGSLTAAGDALYLHRPWPGELYALDRQTLSLRETYSDVLAVAFDGESTTYALTEEGLARLSPSPALRQVDTALSNRPVAMEATADRVYVLGYESLRIFDRALFLVANISLSEAVPRTMTLDVRHQRLYIGCDDGLYALDLTTDQLTRTPCAVRHIQRLAPNAAGSRLYALTHHATDWYGGWDVVALDIDSASGQTCAEPKTLYTTLDGQLRDLHLDEERARLLVASYDDHALLPLNLQTGKVDPRMPVGIEVSEAIVDESTNRLYVSDTGGWVHVLDRRTYEETGRLYGGRHLSLDETTRRLYAGDPRLPVVTVFDSDSLSVKRTIPQPGKPRADPTTGRVVIVNRRFYVYDGATGEELTELVPGTGQPSEQCPSCFYTTAQEVVIDARRGLTATMTYTPWPGKPGPQESIDYDLASGRAYYSLLTGGYVRYSSIALYPDLGQLGERGQHVLYLEGLSGYIRLDPPARRLYVTRGNMLFVLDSETLNRVGRIYTEGWTPVIAALDGELGRFYTPVGSKLVVWTREGAARPSFPPEPTTITGTVASILPSPNYVADHTLLATIDGRLCRSVDGGETWERLHGGLPEIEAFSYAVTAAFSPNYAEDRTLFAGISLGDTHGEGVYRSVDGGETWQSCSSGLYDLRVYQVIPAPDLQLSHTLLAYARTQRGSAIYRSTDRGDRWRMVLQQTDYSTPPLPRPDELLLVTDHLPKFECDYQGSCKRSGDGGATWSPVDTGMVQLGSLVGYALSPHYGHDHTTYFLTQTDLYRYQEDTETWSISTLPVFGDRDYTQYLTSIATAETGSTAHELFVSSVDSKLHRFDAAELRWEQVQVRPLPPTPPPTPTPCVQDVDERLPEGSPEISARLGCPTGPGEEAFVAVQPFQHGLMFWRQDLRQVYVLHQDGTWAAYQDTWSTEQPDHDPDMVPPEGLYQPVHGFGKVWRERLGGPDAQIGWATAQEYGFDTVAQSFARGGVLQGEQGVLYILYADGTWENR